MFKQTPELQKADEEKMGLRDPNNITAPIIFSASLDFNTSSSISSEFQIDQNVSKSASQIDSRDVKAFLKLVAVCGACSESIYPMTMHVSNSEA